DLVPSRVSHTPLMQIEQQLDQGTCGAFPSKVFPHTSGLGFQTCFGAVVGNDESYCEHRLVVWSLSYCAILEGKRVVQCIPLGFHTSFLFRSSGCDLHYLEAYCAKPNGDALTITSPSTTTMATTTISPMTTTTATTTNEEMLQTVFHKRVLEHVRPTGSPKEADGTKTPTHIHGSAGHDPRPRNMMFVPHLYFTNPGLMPKSLHRDKGSLHTTLSQFMTDYPDLRKVAMISPFGNTATRSACEWTMELWTLGERGVHMTVISTVGEEGLLI
ncbi:hypothetical protein GOODEAATRI_032447, partial [Goodea atripinnis]